MYKICVKQALTPRVTLMEIEAPWIAKYANPGQFVMIRIHEDGERFPLTIADYNRDKKTITIIFQVVGASTYLLNKLNENDYILDCAGPLGKRSELDGLKRVLLIGGGVGCAILYPILKRLRSLGTEVYTIIGFKSEAFIFLEDEFLKYSNRFTLVTDDGSKGEKGFVTDILKKTLIEDNTYDQVITIGPLMMMKAVADITRPYNLKTIVSMNPIMVDGTGMCGGCRIKVGDDMKFACVDGPEFDGHLVDFDLAIKRNTMYLASEKEKLNAIMDEVL